MNNSRLQPGDQPGEKDPRTIEEHAQGIRHKIGLAADALQRALDMLASDKLDAIAVYYIKRQVNFAAQRVIEASDRNDALGQLIVNTKLEALDGVILPDPSALMRFDDDKAPWEDRP